MSEESNLTCNSCGESVPLERADVSGTMGDLDPEMWQTLCCPNCGERLKTVFVGSEEV